jgi:hypothetical protein
MTCCLKKTAGDLGAFTIDGGGAALSENSTINVFDSPIGDQNARGQVVEVTAVIADAAYAKTLQTALEIPENDHGRYNNGSCYKCWLADTRQPNHAFNITLNESAVNYERWPALHIKDVVNDARFSSNFTL